MDISDFADSFFEEAEELLGDMERHLLDLDLDDPDPEELNAIFRAAHSIKGGAGAFGFTVLQQTTHILENLLDHARKGELTLRRDIVDTFLETKDMLQEQLAAYRESEQPDTAAFERICAVLQQLARDEVENAGDLTASVPVVSRPEPENESAAGTSLSVVLLNVAEKDRLLLLDELGHLGDLTTTQGDDKRFEVILNTTASADDIEAVLCFVVDTDQLEIRPHQGAIATGDGNRLEVTLNGVAAKDRQQVLEELGNLGDVTGSRGDESCFVIDFSTSAGADDIEAVLGFVIAPDRLAVRAAAAPGTTTASAPAEKPARAADKPAGRSGGKTGDKGKSGGESSSIRVPVDKVDHIINLVGELIITQSMLTQTVSDLGARAGSSLATGVSLLQRNARDLQEAVMSIRMVQMDYVFSRFPRLVRDLAGKLGKEVELVTEGRSTELDKGLIERIIDPLTHLVRNSLDHGIEQPDAREAAGKPRAGKLTLSARHQGGNIIIEVGDDGGGLHRDRILAKARSNGLDVSDTMADDEVWQLIFAAGFSTAEQVSDVSGRGVGMDVVKRNIQSMGGHVEIMSRTGAGTTIRIVLPLTLAILDGMSVRVGTEMFILPLGVVSELLQVEKGSLYTMAADDVLLKVRDEYLPVVSLREVMDVPEAQTNPEDCIAIIVEGESRRYALLIDEPVGQQQVVVKNLETHYRKVPGVSGATILGDGRVALILDVAELHRFNHAKKKHQAASVAGKPQFQWEEMSS